MNGCDFGPGSPGCLDCWDGHCTMNCSSRGGLQKMIETELAERVELTRGGVRGKSIIAQATERLEQGPPIALPADETMTAIANVLGAALPGIPLEFYTPPNDRPHPLFDLLRDATERGVMRATLEELAWPPAEWLKETARPEIPRPIPLGNLYQPGGTLNTSEDRQAIADAFGLKIFADPRVPPGEIWMGLDLSTQPDITACRDADGKIHIITAGKETE